MGVLTCYLTSNSADLNTSELGFEHSFALQKNSRKTNGGLGTGEF